MSEQELSAKMEAVGRLAAGVAHDFNNLLTVINGYSEMLLGQMSEDNPARAGVGQIFKAGQRAEALARQILGLSEKYPVEPELMDLNAVVAEACAALRPELGAGVRLIETAADDGPGPIKADPDQVRQIVIELGRNARDAMPEGGELEIETGRAERGGRPQAKLTVRDNGKGMDAATQARAFEPFFTTKARGRGQGLGLATVYGAVRRNGGWIGFSSAVGRGTCFTVLFPVADKAREETT